MRLLLHCIHQLFHGMQQMLHGMDEMLRGMHAMFRGMDEMPHCMHAMERGIHYCDVPRGFSQPENADLPIGRARLPRAGARSGACVCGLTGC
jgi:hypothetical protein